MEIEDEVKTLREEVEALRQLLVGALKIGTNEDVDTVLCKATTAAGKACTHRAKPGGNGFCGMHGRPSQTIQKVPKEKKPRREVKKKPPHLLHSHRFGAPPGETRGCMVCARYGTGGGWEVGEV